MILVGDIGGTKTDLAVFNSESVEVLPLAHRRFPSREYASLEDIAREFIADIDLPVTRACFAVAGPVVHGRASLTNLPWVVAESSLQAALQVDDVRLLNDVEAMAAAVPRLQPGDLLTLQPGKPAECGAIAVIALGTGLGGAFLTWDGCHYRAHASEGSHNDFAPTSPLESDLLHELRMRLTRVSVERACSGQSIPDLYRFLRSHLNIPESAELAARLAEPRDQTPPIVAAGLDQGNPDALSVAALDMCVSILGTEAGNLALAVLATGGMYVAGGLAQRIFCMRAESRALFLSAFLNKGRLSPVLSQVPVHLIRQPVALLGAACVLLDDEPRVAQRSSVVERNR